MNYQNKSKTQPMGIGNYVGELRQGADGEIYQWNEEADGLGDIYGWWSKVKNFGKKVIKKVLPVTKYIPGTGAVLNKMFKIVVLTNVRSARLVRVPPHFYQKVNQYALVNTKDGAKLKAALRRNPKFYRGGWILKIQRGAAAMTLGRKIFFKTLTPDIFAHELVHVWQYKKMGAIGFLASYFGLSAYTVLKRAIQRKPLNVMDSSQHERQAYAIGNRFASWCKTNSSNCNDRVR